MATPPPPPSDEPVPPPPDAPAPAPPPADPGPGECPRCGSPYEPGQEYCLECGLRLPLVRGFFAGQFVPAMGQLWRRHLRWYPGDWIWPVVFGFVVAAIAGTVAILTTTTWADDNGSRTIVATTETAPTGTATVPPTGTETAPTETTPTETTPTETTPTETTPTETTATETTATTPPPPPPPPPTGPIKWPAGKTGYTVLLQSVAHSDGLPSARSIAKKALDAGLTDVGILNTDNFSNLTHGYYAVFSGVFDTLDEAKSNLGTAQGTFPDAYTRKIAP